MIGLLRSVLARDASQYPVLFPALVGDGRVPRVPLPVGGATPLTGSHALDERGNPYLFFFVLSSQRLSQRLEPGLGDRVHREHRERLDRRLTRRVDDVAASGGAHQRYGLPAGVYGTEQVGPKV